LAESGGVLGVEVATFGDVYRHILEEAGKPVPVVSESVALLLIRSIIDELFSQGRLPYYGQIRSFPGFHNVLLDRFAELKRALVWPEIFVEMTRGSEPKLAELADLYLAFQHKLQDINWADPEGLSWLAVEELEANPRLVADWQLLAVDGFDDFNPTQCRALQLLAENIPETVITLTGSRDLERLVHQRSKRAFEELARALNPEIEYLSDEVRLLSPFTHLESQLFESNPQEGLSSEGIYLVEARSPVEEARESLRWIKSQIQRKHISPDACAIFIPDVELYAPYLKEAANEFGLPIRFTWGEALVGAPSVTALLTSLELQLQDYPRRELLETLRSPYFNWACCGLSPRDGDQLELVSAHAQVVGGYEQWIEALRILSSSEQDDLEDTTEEEELPLPKLPKGPDAFRLLESFQVLIERLGLIKPMPLRDWVVWLEDLMEELDFPARSEPLVLEALRETLRSLVLSESLTEAKYLTYTEFVSNLRGALEGGLLYSPPEPNKPQILIGRLIEARGIRFQAVAILGLSEGIFPEIERPDPFLDESIRAELGLEPRLGRNLQSLFYQAITRADSELLLSRPYLGEGGEPWEPSYFWSAVENLFPEAKTRVQSDAPRSLMNAASCEEALFWATRQGVTPKQDKPLMNRARRVGIAREVLAARLSDQATGPYEGITPDLIEILGETYSANHIWSSSRLEKYGNCPYQFYTSSVLGLETKEPPELGFDAAQLGSMLHGILERVYGEADDPYDTESLINALKVIAVEEFAEAPAKYGFRPSPLWETEQENLLAQLERTIVNLNEISQGWMPAAFELRFGIGEVPPLEIETSIGLVRLRGFIDRVDRNQHGELRIIDYKSGGSGLAPMDLKRGYRLQLPIYALAARDAFGVGEPVDGFYWKIMAAESALQLSKFKYEGYQGVDASYEVVRNHIGRIIQGVRAGEFLPVPPQGGCPKYCPAAVWCWRYEPAF
ncbi:MAG: PD-(D/E)XK nuclease family protein, partial [bacterium]